MFDGPPQITPRLRLLASHFAISSTVGGRSLYSDQTSAGFFCPARTGKTRRP
jgi:hypothetical protein